MTVREPTPDYRIREPTLVDAKSLNRLPMRNFGAIKNVNQQTHIHKYSQTFSNNKKTGYHEIHKCRISISK